MKKKTGSNKHDNGSAITIQVPGKACFLKPVREFIKTITSLSGFSENNALKMVLAVDEACSNIIKHSYHFAEGMIVVQCRIFDDRLEIYLRDYGETASAAALHSRDIDEVKPGGLGCYLINSVMDEVQYTGSEVKGNMLKLVKRKTCR